MRQVLAVGRDISRWVRLPFMPSTGMEETLMARHNTLEYVLAILELKKDEFTAFDLTDTLRMPFGSTYRVLRLMEELGLAERTGRSILRRAGEKWMSRPIGVWRKRVRLLRQ